MGHITLPNLKVWAKSIFQGLPRISKLVWFLRTFTLKWKIQIWREKKVDLVSGPCNICKINSLTLNSSTHLIPFFVFLFPTDSVAKFLYKLNHLFHCSFTPYHFHDKWNDCAKEKLITHFQKLNANSSCRNVGKMSVWKSGQRISFFFVYFFVLEFHLSEVVIKPCIGCSSLSCEIELFAYDFVSSGKEAKEKKWNNSRWSQSRDEGRPVFKCCPWKRKCAC